MSKPKVFVVQTDNRIDPLPYPFEYIPLSIEVNKKMCNHLGYEYIFIPMLEKDWINKHPSYGKIPIVYDFISNYFENFYSNQEAMMIFLDTDAWIQDPLLLHSLIQRLVENPAVHGCFSRDPYIKKNTFVNSGSFILKIDQHSLKMYQSLMKRMEENPQEWNMWPWDQIGFSQYVFDHRQDYWIFVPDILNSGYGKILRHNWNKCSIKMREDLYFHLCNPVVESSSSQVWEWDAVMDREDFPNLNEVGYDYLDFK